jgi:hypothetical protein
MVGAAPGIADVNRGDAPIVSRFPNERGLSASGDEDKPKIDRVAGHSRIAFEPAPDCTPPGKGREVSGVTEYFHIGGAIDGYFHGAPSVSARVCDDSLASFRWGHRSPGEESRSADEG